MRSFDVKRDTKETKIEMQLCLDGKGSSEIDTGCGFLDHMLTLFSKYARVDLKVFCQGDTNVDYHHTAEDVGIVLGQCIDGALGEKRGIKRYGSAITPMDEALIMTALDISGRSCLRYTAEIPSPKVGDFDTELVEEFFTALVRTAKMTMHIRQLDGTNSHHIIEAMFKSFGASVRAAVSIDTDFSDEIPSTKGVL